MATAETLEITRGIDDNVKAIDGSVKVIDGNVKGIDDNVKGMDEKLQNVDKKVEGVDHKIGSVVKGESELLELSPSSASYLVRCEGYHSSHSRNA